MCADSVLTRGMGRYWHSDGLRMLDLNRVRIRIRISAGAEKGYRTHPRAALPANRGRVRVIERE